MKLPKSKSKSEPSAEASKLIFILAGVVVVVTGLKLASDFFIPILLAFFFATISFPITNWLREHRVPRFLAVILTVLVDFAFIAGVVFVGIILVSDISSKWDSKYYNLTTKRLDQLSESTTKFYQEWAPKKKVVEDDEKVIRDFEIEERDGVSVVIPKAELVEDGQPAPDGSPAVADGEAPIDPGATEGGADALAKNGAEKKTADEVDGGAAGIQQFKDRLLQQISTEKVIAWGRSIFDQIMSFVVTAFVVLLITVFMLSEARMFGRRFNAICDAQGPNLQRMLSATKDIQKYLGIKTLISMATGLLAGLLCWQMGLEFPLLWGILAFALNFIPAVGSIIAGIPPILLSLLEYGSIPEAAIIGGGYLLINGVLGNFLEPSLLGRRFGISTVVVILSVIFWGWLWGAVGMLMAVPLTMLLKVALDNSSDLRWIAVAISKETKTSQRSDEILIKESIEAKTGQPAEEAS